MLMRNVLAIDVAKGKSMVTLVSSSGEVLIHPYEINHSINDFSNLSQMARLVNEYQKAIDIIKYKITFLAKKSKYFEPINSIYGIGEFTTSIIIAELGDINRFNNIKELTAYCGLDPSIKQSGKSVNVHGPISKSGNKYMRKILYLACFNIIRLASLSKNEIDIEIYYRKKRNEGKHHYAAIVACTTKLLRKILALCKQLDK